jgi:tetratricopeptide (TPR) repeat protein
VRRTRVTGLLAIALLAGGCHQRGQTHLARGNVLQNQGKIDEAMAEYRAAADADPRASTPWLRIGDLLYGQGKKEEAIAAFQQSADRNPGQMEAWTGLARAQSDLGRLSDARSSLGRALAVRPNDLYARLSRAQLALDQGDVPGALADAEQAVRLDDRNPSSLFLYGSALVAAKDYAAAAATFDRLQASAPSSPLGPYGRARLELARGDRARALDAIRALVAIDPEARSKLATDPHFAELRGDPTFGSLVGAGNDAGR